MAHLFPWNIVSFLFSKVFWYDDDYDVYEKG